MGIDPFFSEIDWTRAMNEHENSLAKAKEEFFQGKYKSAARRLQSIVATHESDWGDLENEAWLFLVACHVLMGKSQEAEVLVGIRALKPGLQANLVARLGEGIRTAFRDQNSNLLRIAVERCTQRWMGFAETDYPRLFAVVEQEIAKSPECKDLPPHNYKTTSFLQWKGGLAAMRDGNYQAALPMLLDSVNRYELGGMAGDALWSWFDVITCELFLDNLNEAKGHYERYAHLSASDSYFVELANLLLKAYENNDAGFVAQARDQFAKKWADFVTSEYPDIFQQLLVKIQARTSGDQSGVQVIAAPSAENPEQFRFLRVRPICNDDLRAICAIMAEVNLASMRGDEVKNNRLIQMSTETLHDIVPWEQGLAFFVAELFPRGGGAPELAGSAKLQLGWGGYWHMRNFTRDYDPTPTCQVRANPSYLAYEPNTVNAIEFAGVTVLPAHSCKKIGRFLTQSRILFLLNYGDILQEPHRIGEIKYVYANLLTADHEGKYPFYEMVVKPLFGELEYDDADMYRYQRSGLRSPILENLLSANHRTPSPHILLHTLPEEVRDNLGLVRTQTIGAQRNLERYHFKAVPKYDILDGGQYFENTLDQLRRRTTRDEYIIGKVKGDDLPPDTPRRTFAPKKRPMAEFVCGRAQALIDGDRLLITKEVFDHLEFQQNEEVVVLTEPEPKK